MGNLTVDHGNAQKAQRITSGFPWPWALAGSISAAPLKLLIWPSLNSMTSVRSAAVANRVQLGVHAAFGAPDTSGELALFQRLAAVRCAFRCVASIMIRFGLPPLPASSAKIQLRTAIDQEPKADGCGRCRLPTSRCGWCVRFATFRLDFERMGDAALGEGGAEPIGVVAPSARSLAKARRPSRIDPQTIMNSRRSIATSSSRLGAPHHIERLRDQNGRRFDSGESRNLKASSQMTISLIPSAPLPPRKSAQTEPT